MAGELVPVRRLGADAAAVLARSPELEDAASSFRRARFSKNTQRAYLGDYARFAIWCRAHGVEPLAASLDVLVLYATWLATEGEWWTHGPVRPGTIDRALVGIRAVMRAKGVTPPVGHALDDHLKGIRRALKAAKKVRKAPLLLEELRRACDSLPATRRGLRDRALLSLGWSWALRRSELVAVRREHLRPSPEGIALVIEASKTDQEGEGVVLGVPPSREVDAVLEWLALVPVGGHVFVRVDKHDLPLWGRALEGGQVARIVKRAAKSLGREVALYGAHSLRAGWLTQASADGVPLQSIMRHSRHRSVKVAMGYIRDASPFDASVRGVWKP